MSLSEGPTQLILLTSVARSYYLDGRSKIEIGEALGMSRFKVARLLDAARAAGLVRIEVAEPDAIDVELSTRLRLAFGLRHVVVLPDSEDGIPRERIGKAAAGLLMEVLTERDVLGLAWSRSVNELTNALTRLPPVTVVQLTGALVEPGVVDTSVDLVRRVARLGGGAAHYFYAPTIVSEASTATALHRQPEIRRTFGRFASVTTAVVGVGHWTADGSTVCGAVDRKLREQLARHGVVAELAGILIDQAGEPVESSLSERIIGIDYHQLRAVPETIGLAHGADRSVAVRSAILGGLITSLVTDSSLAKALIDN